MSSIYTLNLGVNINSIDLMMFDSNLIYVELSKERVQKIFDEAEN